MPDQPTLYLIDGSSYLYRPTTPSATFPGRRVSDQRNLRLHPDAAQVLKDRQPTHVAVVFDISRKTFRTDLYPSTRRTGPPCRTTCGSR